MSRRKERLVITCDGCRKDIDQVGLVCIVQHPADFAIPDYLDPLDFCQSCRDRLLPAMRALREPSPVKPSWWSRIFGGAR